MAGILRLHSARSADHWAKSSMRFLVMQAEALQRDPQDDLARASGPAKFLFGYLKPFKQTAAAQGNIPQPVTEIAQRVTNAFTRG